MNQFRNKDLKVSQQTFSHDVPNPVTPLPSDVLSGPIAPLFLSESDDTAMLPTISVEQEQDTAGREQLVDRRGAEQRLNHQHVQ